MDWDYAVASFRSRQQVMSFAGQLRRAGINAEVVSTPREIAVGCGLSVRFDVGDIARVRDICRHSPPQNMIGVYRAERVQGARTRFVPIMGARGM